MSSFESFLAAEREGHQHEKALAVLDAAELFHEALTDDLLNGGPQYWGILTQNATALNGLRRAIYRNDSSVINEINDLHEQYESHPTRTPEDTQEIACDDLRDYFFSEDYEQRPTAATA